MERELIDRFRGCIYCQAIGDALGLGTEFMTDEDIAWKYPHGFTTLQADIPRQTSETLEDRRLDG